MTTSGEEPDCPICKRQLEHRDGSLYCAHCELRYQDDSVTEEP